MTFTLGFEIFTHTNPFTYTEGATMTGTKTKTKTTNIFAPARYRTKCPRCGYALAMADTGRDEIHCASCHGTSAIPTPIPEIPDVEIISEQVEIVVNAYGPGLAVSRRSPTVFAIEYYGDRYLIAVTPDA